MTVAPTSELVGTEAQLARRRRSAAVISVVGEAAAIAIRELRGSRLRPEELHRRWQQTLASFSAETSAI